MTSPRIERGAALLDTNAPGWPERINLDTLDLSSGMRCILGQLYGDYDKGLKVIDGKAENQPALHGFFRYGSESWWALTDKWRVYIEARRAKQAA